ncbi:MAG: acetyl-CoA carboxylase biotin carboxyl carrier protein [Robiginitomaculum sp.]
MAQKPKTPQKTNKTETDLVRELAEILNDTGLSEIEMEKGTLRLRVARTLGHAAAPVVMATSAAPVATSASKTESAEPTSDPGAVTSPMVGTAYSRPSPDDNAFVSVGDSVKADDTVMLVEAMKTFNPIKAPKAGMVKKILVEDGQPVEFGEALLIIG